MNIKRILALIMTSLAISAHAETPLTAVLSNGKTITVKQAILTPVAIKYMTADRPTLNPKSALPPAVNLGMNGVPVLDQGTQGTCETFAISAAMDALLGKGDYISQLCSLELGDSLTNYNYAASGWTGAYSDLIAQQMITFGVVPKDTQANEGCAGVHDYPMDAREGHGTPISLDEYHSKSVAINQTIFSSAVVTGKTRRLWLENADPSKPDAQATNALTRIKAALIHPTPGSKSLVALGIYFPMGICHVGACGALHYAEDTWTYSNSISHSTNLQLGAHEVVVIGYDDNAIVKDLDGSTHQGVLIVRNSWGAYAGDHGNYYVSYDYFMRFFSEVTIISAVTSS